MRSHGFNKFTIQQNHLPEEMFNLFKWAQEEAK